MNNNIINIKNIFKFKYFYFICIFFAVFNVNHSFAQDHDKNNKQIDDPVQFLHSTIEQVLIDLKKHHSTQKDINQIVDNLIMPEVNFDEMCQWITGRSIWAKSSDKQKSEFTK
ncbi:MAG: ABC transporter substrate-binding protein, partial [Gammaproteobacteria bacterium]